MSRPVELIEVSGTYPKLDIIDHGGWGYRHEAFLMLLEDVFQRFDHSFSGKKLKFFFYSGDRARSAQRFLHLGPVFANCTTERLKDKIIPIPDFLYTSGKEVGIEDWETIVKQCAKQAALSYEYEQCFWIGDAQNHRSRKKLLKLSERTPQHLKALDMKWAYNQQGSGYHFQDGIEAASAYIPIPEQAKYKYLIDIPGIGYSSRLKLLMHLKRPVFLVERDDHEFFYPYLIPYKHYIPVKQSLSDLIPQIKWLDQDKKAYERVVHETDRFAHNYLSKNFAIEYFYRMITDHALIT